MKSISKKIAALILTTCLITSLFACSLPLGGGGNEPEKNGVTKATSLVTIDINPSIELTLDADGTVASVYGANEDGQILLYGEAEALVGIDYETALDKITALAKELGYLTEETAKIHASVITDSESVAAELTGKVSARLEAAARDNGITVSVDTEDPFSLLCELEAFKEKYPDDAEIQALTPTKYKLAMTLSEREDISVIAALEYDDGEIIERINAAHATLESYATDTYLAAKSRAVSIFDTAMGILIDGVYSEIYLFNILAHTNTYYYGAVYQGYKTLARTYKSVYDIKVFADDMASFELDDATAAQIAAELGVEDTSLLEDENGKVTLDSLIAFCDEFVASGAASDEVKAKIEGYVADARNAAELASKGTTDLYKTDMESLKTQIDTVISSISTAYETAKTFMSEEARADVDACMADLRAASENIAKIITEGVTQSEIEAMAADAEAKATAMLERIKADLSETELKLAETKIAALEAQRDLLTEQFEARLSTAEAEARSYIEQKRAERESAQ